MDSFLISPEAEEQLSSWLSAFSPDTSSLLACNDPDARKAMIEAAINAYPAPTYRPVLLDLSETRVTNLAEDLIKKIGNPEELASEAVIHVINLELSLLESIALDGASDQWAKDLEKGFPFPIHLYGDEKLFASLQDQSWKESVSPSACIGEGETRLPYQQMKELVSKPSFEPFEVAELLAMSGAIAHSEYWYQQQEEKGGHDLERVLGLGELALHRRKFETATAYFEEAGTLQTDSSSSALMARLSLGKGRIAFAARDWKTAIISLTSGLRELSAADSREEVGEINRMIGRAWEQKGEPEKAIDRYLQAAATWAEDPSFAMAAAKAYQHAGAICQNQFRFPEAKEHFSSALTLAETASDEFLQASLEDSIEAMSDQIKKKEKKGGKGLFGKLFS